MTAATIACPAPADTSPAPAVPEHCRDRRRFLVWAVLSGFAPPERMTERIVAEIEREAREVR
jgi:hypothetical protein